VWKLKITFDGLHSDTTQVSHDFVFDFIGLLALTFFIVKLYFGSFGLICATVTNL